MEKQYFFASDLHLSHKNILKYDKRPFASIDHHDECLIANWNAKVGQDDDIYYLGDFALTKPDKCTWLMSRLQGNKFFIKGNHDHNDMVKLYEKSGTYLGEFKEIEVKGQKIVLCHYALRVWNKSHRGSWHLYGHSHGSLPDDPTSLSIDVGVNLHGYAPVSFEHVAKIMSKKKWVPIDHHGK